MSMNVNRYQQMNAIFKLQGQPYILINSILKLHWQSHIVSVTGTTLLVCLGMQCFFLTNTQTILGEIWSRDLTPTQGLENLGLRTPWHTNCVLKDDFRQQSGMMKDMPEVARPARTVHWLKQRTTRLNVQSALISLRLRAKRLPDSGGLRFHTSDR